MALGALIHEFGWGPDDFDQLAAGTLAGHLLECSAQVTGGTFTDWQDVPDWAHIGMPIGECRADGGLVVTKPEGTGGLVSVGTVAEQLLYEVSDPQRYYVADVICDFTGVQAESQVGPDRVEVTGARGLGRTDSYKASLTYEAGWRASAAIPIVGREAGAKARRTGEELFIRASSLLRDSQLPPFERTRCDVFDAVGSVPPTAICRIVADHRDQAGAQVLAREQGTAMIQMSVGTTHGAGRSGAADTGDRWFSDSEDIGFADCHAERAARVVPGDDGRPRGRDRRGRAAFPARAAGCRSGADSAPDCAGLGKKRRQGQHV